MRKHFAVQGLTRAFDSGPQRSDGSTSDTPVCWLTGMMETACGADGEEEIAPTLLAVRFSPDPVIVSVASALPGCTSRITALLHVPGARSRPRSGSDATTDKEKEKEKERGADTISVSKAVGRGTGLFDGLASRSEKYASASVTRVNERFE